MHAHTDPVLQPASLRVEYRDAAADTLLADPRLLALFTFGTPALAGAHDPRWLQVALPTLGDAPHECWFAEDQVRHGCDDGIAWSSDGRLQFGSLQVADDGDIEQATAHAYRRLQAWLARCGFPHALRIWNYMDAITAGRGDAERYRRFCVGRADGIGRALAPGELPAATAIGHPHATGRFQLYWLAAAQAGTPLENPRQVQAWRYPRQYGPQAPGFARAMLPASPAMPLLISGTAAVVGHASQHGDAVDAQLDEALANVHALVEAARRLRPALPAELGQHTRLKAYVRDAAAMAQVDALLAQRLPDVPRIVLHGHVCRRELAVEIDGVHA